MDYLLRLKNSNNDNDKKFVKVLKGDAKKSLDLALSLDFSQQHKIGCLSFEEPNISDEQKLAIMESFEKMAFAGLEQDQYNICWIEHTDKGRLELNFFIPQVELSTGKRLQTYYVGADKQRFRFWQDLTNLQFDLSNPNDYAKKQITTPNKRISEKAKDVQTKIIQIAKDFYRQQQKPYRSEFIAHLKDLGYQVPRAGKDYITILTQDGIRTRLKGELFTSRPNLSFVLGTPKLKEPEQKPLEKNLHIKYLQLELKDLMAKKASYNQERYNGYTHYQPNLENVNKIEQKLTKNEPKIVQNDDFGFSF